MEKLKDTKNELLRRQELVFELEADKNPGFEEMKKKIAEESGKSEDSIKVNRILGKFGQRKFKVEAFIYDSKEELEKNNRKSRKQRAEEKKASEDAKKAEAEAKKASAEKAAEEKKAEAPKEEEKKE